MSSLLYLNQALRFASHTSRLAVMIDSDATSVSGGDVLFLVMTCFAILGAGQLVIWIMNCPLSFGKQSQDKANTGTQEDDDEGVLMASDIKAEVKSLKGTIVELQKQLKAAEKKNSKEGTRDDGYGKVCRHSPRREIWVAAPQNANNAKYHLNKSCQGLNNAGGLASFELCIFCERAANKSD